MTRPRNEPSRRRSKDDGKTERPKLLSRIAVGYSVFLLIVVMTVRTVGDIIAPLTFYLYSPRWVILLPSLFLLLLGVRRRLSKWAIVFSFVSIVAVLFGLLDYRYPSVQSADHEPDLRVMTFNALMSSTNADAILGYAKIAAPDIIALQESRALDIELPEEYSVYRYGELSVATKFPVVSCPETQHAFRGKLSNLRIFGRALEATEVRALYGEQPLSRNAAVLAQSLDVSQSPKGQQLELPASRLPAQFTIELRLRCVESDSRQFVFEFGSLEKGFNAYLDGNTITIGSWQFGSARWIGVEKVPFDRELHLCVVHRSGRFEAYVDGGFVGAENAQGKLISEAPEKHEFFCLGSFRGVTRCNGGYGFFPHRCITLQLDVVGRPLVVSCIHNPTPRNAFEEPSKFFSRYQLFRVEAEAVHREHERQLAAVSELPIIVMGDFNMPYESRLYREHWGSLSNAFNQSGVGFGHTKDTQLLGTSYGARIDHILCDRHLVPTKCWVGPNLFSDHFPLVAELEWIIDSQ